MKRLLFLGYDRDETPLLGFVEDRGWIVAHTREPVSDLSDYDRVVSFGYRHILREPVLRTARSAVLNLHISYLPWNRGAHPLFWSFFDGTPLGVTIHEIDAGVDTGAIRAQKRVDLDGSVETFVSGRRRLLDAVEALFRENATPLLDGTGPGTPQIGAGTSHKARDLPPGFDWTDTILPTIARLRHEAAQRSEGAG